MQSIVQLSLSYEYRCYVKRNSSSSHQRIFAVLVPLLSLVSALASILEFVLVA